MKTLYKFTIDKTQDVEKTELNDDGSKTIKTVKENVPVHFAIKKPSRMDAEDAELYYNQKYNQFLKAEILPEVLLRKMYGNENGIFTEKEKEDYVNFYIQLGETLSEIKDLEKLSELTEEQKERVKVLFNLKMTLQRSIVDYENAKQGVLENSAEALSRGKIIFWWLLRLLQEEVSPEKFKSVFPSDSHDPSKSHEERATIYDVINDKIEEGGDEGEFYINLLKKASELISLFYFHGITNPKEFQELVERYYAEKDGESKSEDIAPVE